MDGWRRCSKRIWFRTAAPLGKHEALRPDFLVLIFQMTIASGGLRCSIPVQNRCSSKRGSGNCRALLSDSSFLALTLNRQRLCELEGQTALRAESDIFLASSVGHGSAATAPNRASDGSTGAASGDASDQCACAGSATDHAQITLLMRSALGIDMRGFERHILALNVYRYHS